MTSSITEFTNESLRPISEPGRFIDVPDRQGYIPNMTSCLNEIKVIPKDEKEVNSAFTEPPTPSIHGLHVDLVPSFTSTNTQANFGPSLDPPPARSTRCTSPLKDVHFPEILSMASFGVQIINPGSTARASVGESNIVKRTDVGPFPIADEDERERTLVEIHRRETDIDRLKAGIRVLKSQQRQKDNEDHEHIRPILDELHAQMFTLQEKIAVYWRDYQRRILQHRQETERVIRDIQSKVWALEQENSYAASLLAPIRRLPAEMLSEIFTIAITVYGCSSLRLMRVCHTWRYVLVTTPRIWSTIIVRTWTKPDYVKFLLERTGRVTLDVEIDTDSDSGSYIPDPSRSYAALAMVAKTSTRWRNLTILSFPRELDLMNSRALGSGLVFEEPMEALESFRITGSCEMNTALSKLISLARNVNGPQLKTLELSISDALFQFSKPPSSPFQYLRSFKVELTDMKDPLDILPQFKRLEDLHAHSLHLPLYSDTTHLPLVHTLKRLFLKKTSVQWLQGRSFSKLLDCTIMWPHLPEALLTGVRVNLPHCTHLTYDDHMLQPLTAFDLPSLDALVVRNEAWNRPRGSQQLGFIWGPIVPAEKVLRPRVLHLDTQCFDQYLISALKVIPEVEELTLGLVRPDALGKKFLSSLLAKRVKEDSINTHTGGHGSASSTRNSPAWVVSLCPNLKALGFKYRRWLREHESDGITPIFQEIVDTRAKSNAPLQSFKFWPTKDTKDEEAKELVARFIFRGQP